MRIAPVLLLLLFAVPAAAQIQPVPGDADPRLQSVDYEPGRVVQLRGAPGYQLMVELSPDEQVQNVAIGDSSAWQVSINRAGDRLFLKPTVADVSTNLTVVTSVRIYNFELYAVPGPSGDLPFTVQFRYPALKTQAADPQYVDVSAASRRLSRYRISGDRELRPAAVTDDGQRTYIRWPVGAPIPAIYAPDRAGKEALVNGMMGTDDIFVVDGAPQMLIFRIDRTVARAVRINPRKGR